MARLMRDAARRMSVLIDNLLDLARGRLGGGLILNRNANEPLEPVLRPIVTELKTTHPDPIPLVALERLFQPSYRSAMRHDGEGLGLGLYIAHEIATAHGGTLNAQSTQEKTRFTFRMPAI